MKKGLIAFFLALAGVLTLYISANAVEIQIQGKGYASITGYDVNTVHSKQDVKIQNKGGK